MGKAENEDTLKSPGQLTADGRSAADLPDVEANSALSPKYGLMRIVAVNSYVKNRARIVQLDDDTHISGRNGRGKTSLLRLIPLFLGEQPSRMVKPSGEGMKPLREYIFDSLSAYLVFEYRNANGMKMAVMFYSNKGAPSYLFCDGTYEPELFCERGQYVESRTLNARLKGLGRNPTPSMGVTDYQTVIQGRMERARSGELRNYIRRFALASQGNLAGIEKIASAMFFKDITFAALKRMAYSVMNETGDDVISANMTDKSMDRFFANFRAYDDVMHFEATFNEGRALHHAYRDALRQRRDIAIKANLLSQHYLKELDTLNSSLNDLDSQIRQAANSHGDVVRKMNEDIAKTTSSLTQADELISAVEREQKRYESQNIDAKRALVSSISQVEQRLSALNGHLRALTEASVNIHQKYDRQLNLLYEQSEARLKPLHAEREAARDQATERQAALAEELAARRHILEEEHAKAESSINDQLQRASDELLALTVAHAELKPDFVFTQQLDGLSERRATLATEAEQYRIRTVQISDEISQAKDLHGQLEARAAQTTRTLQAKKAERDHLQNLHAPAPDTLLHFLRENSPGWYDHIGKVVRDDVLLNTAMTPTLADELGAKNLYGVDIDLSKIESSLAAREQSLAEEIQNLRDSIEEDSRRLSEQDDELRGLGEKIRHLSQRKNEAEAVVDMKKRAIEELDSQAVKIRHAAAEELNVRRAAFTSKIEAASAEQKRLLTIQKDRPGIRKQQLKDLTNTFSQRGRDIAGFLNQELARIASNILEEENQYNETKTNIFNSRDAELKKGGVDTSALRKIESQIVQETACLEHANQARTIVDEYERWRSTRPAEKEKAAMALLGYRQLLDKQNADRNEVIDEYQKYHALLRARVEEQTLRRDKATNAQSKLDSFRSRHGTEALGYDLKEPFEPLGWTLELLAKEYGLYDKKLKESHHRRNELIYPIHKAFMSAGENTHVKTFSLKMPVSIIDSNDETCNIEEIIEVLKNWFGTGHIQSRDSINIECQAACGQFDSYFSRLNAFRENVANLSRQLQNNLNADMVFDAISSVSLRLSGKVERLAYWDELASVVREYKRWKESECRGLPPRELFHQLKAMMAKISGTRLEESPENLIDMEILVNDGREKRVSNEAELKNVSSNGLSYMIMCMIFVSFVNRVRKDKNVWLTWALDEIGAIDPGNSNALLSMLDKHRINLVSAAPEGSENILSIFKHHYEILENFEIQRCAPATRRNHRVS